MPDAGSPTRAGGIKEQRTKNECPPANRSEVGALIGRAVFDNVGAIQLIHSASEVPTLSEGATSESASGRWAPRNESIEANAGARCQPLSLNATAASRARAPGFASGYSEAIAVLLEADETTS